MKIKNIRQYRTAYKEVVRDIPNRNEHHMGTVVQVEGKRQFGWFEVYHGDKEGYGKAEQGIGNFLQSFLDMAKDGQAVYEFLQNAVDAGASHFTMAWGKDEVDGQHYVMVANNGKMFDFDSIRSILNVGSSTKTADSQSIGKFGIGFKLAHRLVGRENGLVELLSNSSPSGPILFSWKNAEITKLGDGELLEPQNIELTPGHDGRYQINDDNPWLFKILITCFPALPQNGFVEEDVLLPDGQKPEHHVFSSEEYATLGRWVKRYRDILDSGKYREGSLFFIKLGQGKENELADYNLAEGVRFSLAILQETAEEGKKERQVLTTVQLNKDEPIQKPDLQYHYFKITKKESLDRYLFIRFGINEYSNLSDDQKLKFEREDDIEVLFGFRGHNDIADYFNGAPNFYLYFPLSEEVHNFNFVLHSNAFYKASSRTFLHKGTTGEDGINERLLREIAKRLENELQLLYDDGEHEKFLNLYAALLTSGESQNHERQWVKQPFVEEITTVLRRLVPVRKNMTEPEFYLSSIPKPKIKKTAIEIPPAAFGVSSFEWFYWPATAPRMIYEKAFYKLDPFEFDIFKLLQKPNVYSFVNQWIEEDRTRVATIFDELATINGEKARTEDFKSNLKNLKLFEFSDGSLFSDNELTVNQDKGFIVLHNGLAAAEAELRRIGLHTSKIDLDSYEFYRQYNSYLNTDSQLRSQAKVIELVSNGRVEVLSPAEKTKVFVVLRDLTEEGRRKERLSELRLFRNQSGECIKIKYILKATGKFWLEPFRINAEEQSQELDRYLDGEEKAVYENIVYQFWPEISDIILKAQPGVREQIVNEIRDYYDKSPWARDKEKLLSDHLLLFFEGGAREVDNPLFDKELNTIDPMTYAQVQKTAHEKLSVQIPDHAFLFCYQNVPFLLGKKPELLNIEKYQFSLTEVTSVLLLAKSLKYEVFDNYTVYEEQEGLFTLLKDKVKNFYSEGQAVPEYVTQYHASFLHPLPQALNNFKDIVQMQGDYLYNHLTDRLDIGNEEQVFSQLNVIRHASTASKVKLFHKLPNITFFAIADRMIDNKRVFDFVDGVRTVEGLGLSEIQKKVVIKSEQGLLIRLSEIDEANDQIMVRLGDTGITLSRSKLLNLKNENAIPIILAFAQDAINNNLSTSKEINDLFKIEAEAITEQLGTKFKEVLTHQDYKLSNSDQLILGLILYSAAKSDFVKFKVLNGASQWVVFEGNWIFPSGKDLGWYKPEFVLDAMYEDALARLKFNDVFMYRATPEDSKNEDENLIAPCFYFRVGCSVNALRNNNGLIPCLEFLLASWRITPSLTRTRRPKQQWSDLLGFDPRTKVYADYTLGEETLDSRIIDWLHENKKDKLEMLQAIGVNGLESDVSKLRRWLMEASDSESCPVVIGNIPLRMLSNTLVGLAEKFISHTGERFRTKENSKKHQIINEMVVKLLEQAQNEQVRLPVWTPEGLVAVGSQTADKPVTLMPSDYQMVFQNKNEHIKTSLFQNVQILLPNPAYGEFLNANYGLIRLNREFVKPVDEEEHKEPFYKSWSSRNGVRLIKVAKLLYKCSFTANGSTIALGEIDDGDHHYIAENRLWYYRSGLPLENLLEASADELGGLIKELISERDKMLAAFYTTITASGRDGFDNDDSKRLLQALNERNFEEKRSEIVREISESQRYSYNWFIQYIKYLLTFEELADTVSQKSISFQKIERFLVEGQLSRKYFLLRGANSLIPLNIESFEDFSIEITFTSRHKEQVIVEGVSKKGQDLLVYVPQGMPDKLVNSLNKVVNVSISFSPVLDLIQRLHDSFSNSDFITPWNDVLQTLPPLRFIYGPPGTGKTTRLKDQLLERVGRDPFYKALVLVPTNKAGDVLAKRIIEESQGVKVVRIGKATDPELEKLEDDVYQGSLTQESLAMVNVLITTIHRLPYYQVSVAHGANFRLFDSANVIWDEVLFDEASMINLPYATFALFALKPKNTFIISGDPKQIPPVVDTSDKNLETLEMSDESIYKMLNINSFDEGEQNVSKRSIDSIENLDKQYRSVAPIGHLFSSFSYDDRLEHKRDFGAKPFKELPKGFISLFSKPVSFIDFPVDSFNSILEPKKLLHSPYHVYAGILTSELIRALDKSNREQIHFTIGVISPYKAQAMLMNKLILASGISSNITVHCDTVHGFQGDECDIVVFVVNPNNHRYTGDPRSLLSKEYIYNVAISRAKDHLWILCPLTSIPNNPHINKLRGLADKSGSIIKSDAIEQQLFKESEFIVKNSYLTGHDNINVFGQVEMSYFIKAGNTAIDLQLRL